MPSEFPGRRQRRVCGCVWVRGVSQPNYFNYSNQLREERSEAVLCESELCSARISSSGGGGVLRGCSLTAVRPIQLNEGACLQCVVISTKC